MLLSRENNFIAAAILGAFRRQGADQLRNR